MRMFQSVSRHSKVHLKTAHSQLYCSYKVSPTLFQTDLRITDHREHKFPLSLTLLAVQNTNRMASRLAAIPGEISARIFQLLQYSRQHRRFLAHWADLTTKTDSTFRPFSIRIVDFAVQFFLRCKFSFDEKRLSI